MADLIQSLRDVDNGPWHKLGEAMRAALPVPAGFVAVQQCREEAIRDAYNDLKIREHTHYVAVRAPSHAKLDIIGNDALVHTLRGLWSESANASILIQAMVNGSWCGKAALEGKNLRIRASEGLMCLDPDTYLFNTGTDKCTRRTLYQQPRKMFRAIDGRTRTMEITGERQPLEVKHMEAIAELATRAGYDITWVVDERRVWLIGVGKKQ